MLPKNVDGKPKTRQNGSKVAVTRTHVGDASTGGQESKIFGLEEFRHQLTL
jgi:hypothetical protein